MIKEIAFVAYSVRDVPAAVAFYRDTLGLRQDGIDADGWVEFDVGGVPFGIGNGEPLGFIPGASTGLMLEVDDVAAERTRLLERGVKVGDRIETPVCFMAFVTTPPAISSASTSANRARAALKAALAPCHRRALPAR